MVAPKYMNAKNNIKYKSTKHFLLQDRNCHTGLKVRTICILSMNMHSKYKTIDTD